jgi:translation initiation factor 2-alpha kinase 4
LDVVKKIKLQGGKKSADEKILREVSALRLLTHRYIVRYYTTWTEIAAPTSRANSDSDSDDSDTDTVDGTSVPNSRSRSSRGWSNNSENLLSIDLNDFGSNPNSNRSFPNVHFGYADGTSPEGSSDEEPPSEDESRLGVDSAKTPKALTVGSFTPQQKVLPRGSQVTLYIQMVCSLVV